MITITPPEIHSPLGHYAHGISIPANHRVVVTAGQVAVRPDGSIPDNLQDQCTEIWRSLTAILDQDGLALSNIAHVRGYIVDPDGVSTYGKEMERILGSHKAASTLVVVAALAAPEFLVEIEVLACVYNPE